MTCLLGLPLILALASCNLGDNTDGAKMAINPASMPKIGTVDERFQSYNIEMAEVIGGNFWKPYDQQDDQSKSQVSDTAKIDVGAPNSAMFQKMEPIDLSDARLRKLASALAALICG